MDTETENKTNTEPVDSGDVQVHTEDIQEIIGTPPHALLRWGITWVFLVILTIVGLSAFIDYPDIVKTPLRISTTNSPKVVTTKFTGNLVRILVTEGERVERGHVIGWMESTADHRQVQKLLGELMDYRERLGGGGNLMRQATFAEVFTDPSGLQLGELQQAYQTFYSAYIAFRSTQQGGVFEKRRHYLQQEVQHIHEQRHFLESQLEIQERDLELARKDFERHRNLVDKKVISASEFERQQSAFLGRQQPVQQTQSSLLTNDGTLHARQKEMAELDQQIMEQQAGFRQALNSLISQVEEWQQRYLLIAPETGVVVFAGIIQENQHLDGGADVFYINPGNSDFFGEVRVPQYNMGKVHQGQRVLIKLDSYPFEEFGVLHGHVSRFNHVPIRDSLFLARIEFSQSHVDQRIQLRPGLN